ncbi:MAG: multicopper oxidase family protein [Candidatus Binatia bacterium]
MRIGKGITRRAVLRGGALGVAALSAARVVRAAGLPYVPRPAATQYVIPIAAARLAPAGAAAVPAILAGGTLPGPEIRLREGTPFRALVQNQLDAPTTIHWHGVLVPSGMDGVPDISNAPIAPGGVYVYEYPIRQAGTYWYHSHYGFQEQLGCYGAFVIEPADEPLRVEHDAVILLGDWLQRDPATVFASLRGGAPMGAMPMGAAKMGGKQMDPPAGVAGSAAPMAATPAPMAMGGGADLSDVQYDAFLLNGRGPADPWTLEAVPGARVRLRIVNGGASTFFRLRLDGHRLRITHADGLAVEPVEVDHLLIGMGEVYDAVVTMAAAGSYTLHAVAQDGSGQAIGVLHTPGTAAHPNRRLPAFDGRALRYADLRAIAPTTLPDGPPRPFRLPLQGDMAKYVWMIDGQAWPQADALRIRRGDRVQVEMINQTSMWHPMHLHGHFFRLLQGAGEHCPLKHTVSLAPGETARIEFTADNPGNWFFHCHNVYHLEAGMARVFVYEA